MEAVANIEFSESVTSSEAVDEFGDEWEWVMVADSPLIELSIVVDWSKAAVFLLDEEERCGVGTSGRLDVSFCELVVDVFIHGFKFSLGQWVGFAR